ncbi:MAG: bifunctional hydroxymethylpyrimidine kinase/phosphomethylpyrimidine kinase [Myxococcales bacterium]|nr:bifunctional hydroxymethylpyrimidine kinase/phosphomethylpyrimidine kinase [Myxococcales bacterium]
MPPVALSIAGSDPSGGAGLQADLKTFHQHRVYGCAVASLLTAQSTVGLGRVQPLPADWVAAQLSTLLADMVPQAVKTGALGSAENVREVARQLAGRGLPLVIDPVRVASRGGALLADDGREALLEALLPLSALITPNAMEAAWLVGGAVEDEASALEAARQLLGRGAGAVLIKAGHLPGATADDLLCRGDSVLRLSAPRLQTRAGHGFGCALSAAITAWLARGADLESACRRAKTWLGRALASAPELGAAGRGPLDHSAPIDESPL